MKVQHADEMEWSPSPRAGVWRKRFEQIGPPEAGIVTSLVRYDPGSRFHPHPHPDGEEILVLAGTFSDHTGDHGPGSYLLNPEGFEHAPSSNEGCDIFVKLRQYPGDRPTVRIDTQRSAWEPYRFDGVTRCPLYESPDLRMHLLRFAPGTALPEVLLPQRETIFVVDGTFHDEHGDYRAGSYLAFEPGEGHQPTSPQGCLLYISLSAN